MRNLFKGLVTVLVLLLVAGCILVPSGNSIYAYWSWTGTVLTISTPDTTMSLSATIDNDLDDYFSAMIMHITEDSLITYMNDPTDGSYQREAQAFTKSGDSLVLEDEDNMYQELDGDQLTLTTREYGDNDSTYMELQMIFTKYTGNVPPTNWTSPLHDDIYEPDTVNFTSISAGETQAHTLPAEDIDFYTFTATQNHTYLFQVNAYIDLELYLYDTDSNLQLYDDDNDDDIDLEGPVECAFRATFNVGGEYWPVVAPYSDDDIGYYEITITDEGTATAKPTNAPAIYEEYVRTENKEDYINKYVMKYFFK